MVIGHKLPARRILVACYEVPGHGGAATSAYALFRKMQSDGLDVSLLNIISSRDSGYFRYLFGERMGNPGQLDHVHNCEVDQARFHADPADTPLPALAAQLAPDVIIAVDAIPAALLKRCLPESPLVFLACGSDQAMWHFENHICGNYQEFRALLESSDYPVAIQPGHEKRAMASCDLMIANSDLVKDLYTLIYPTLAGKISPRPVWFAEWICEDVTAYRHFARPFSERTYDLLFTASLWHRAVKNWPLVAKIINRCSDLKIAIAGEIDNPPAQVVCLDFVASREAMLRLIGDSRVVVSASIMDTAPGVLYEAAVMDCNLVTSRNCGNWRLCHEDLLVTSFTADGFTERIKQAQKHKVSNHLDEFLALGCYEDLIDTVAVCD